MANKQIKDLDLIGNNINAASDFLIIQKADGSTYKVTVDQLINSSTTVSYGSSTGAPTVISEQWTSGRDAKTITTTNMFDTTSAGVLTLATTRQRRNNHTRFNHSITKVAGLNMITLGTQSISVGGPEVRIQTGLFVTGGKFTTPVYMWVSCTKNSLIIKLGSATGCQLAGQISIVPS